MTSKKEKSKGLLTIDFIFSFLALWGVFMLFLMMSFTLMMASVSQYIIFSTNRAHISSHIDQDKQTEVGVRKFEQLVSALAPLISTEDSSWYKVELEEPGPIAELSPTQVSYGFKLQYTATVLKNTEFPIIGGPGTGEVGDNFAKATLKAYMYREPSTEECLQFNNTRWQKILTRFPNLNPYISGAEAYGSSADNGC